MRKLYDKKMKEVQLTANHKCIINIFPVIQLTFSFTGLYLTLFGFYQPVHMRDQLLGGCNFHYAIQM